MLICLKIKKTEKKIREENLPGIFGTIGLTTMAVDRSVTESERFKKYKQKNKKKTKYRRLKECVQE